MYITPPSRAAGYTVTDAAWAQDIVANMTAMWPDIATTAGDMTYATAADTATRLAIGSAAAKLRVNAGATAPQWAAFNYVIATQTAADTTTSASFVNTSLSVAITTVGTIAHLLLTNAYHISTAGDNGELAWNVDGGADNTFSVSTNGAAEDTGYYAVATGLSAAAHTFRIRFRRSSGTNGNYTFGRTTYPTSLVVFEP